MQIWVLKRDSSCSSDIENGSPIVFFFFSFSIEFENNGYKVIQIKVIHIWLLLGNFSSSWDVENGSQIGFSSSSIEFEENDCQVSEKDLSKFQIFILILVACLKRDRIWEEYLQNFEKKSCPNFTFIFFILVPFFA